MKTDPPHCRLGQLGAPGSQAGDYACQRAIDHAPDKGPVRDAAIVAQYQRMTHYGITGFGTMAAFAKALKLDDDHAQLKAAGKDMYKADELTSELAEAAVNADAVDE